MACIQSAVFFRINFILSASGSFKLTSKIVMEPSKEIELLCYADYKIDSFENFPKIFCVNSTEGYLYFEFNSIGGNSDQPLMTTTIPSEGSEFISILTRKQL